MKKKVLLGAKFRHEGFEKLDKDFELTYPEKDYFKKNEVLDIIEDFDVFVPGSKCDTDKELIDKAKNLKLIANFGVGYDNIDVEYAASKGITVTNTPDAVRESTAELCFALILAAARRIAFYDRHVREPEGLSWGIYDHLGVNIFDKTLGIFGMGRIGQSVARRAVASGMNIIYHNREPLDKETEKKYNAKYVDFDELLSKSDFISLNAPATDETHHLIGKNEIEKMKTTAILINTSRGSVIEEQALINALSEKRIRGAALDVFETEPWINDKFKKLENVVLTPHAGTQTCEARINMQKELAENIIGFFEGKKISKVNK